MMMSPTYTGYTEKYRENSLYEQQLLLVIAWLLLGGIVMVYSSSITYATGSSHTGHNPNFFLIRHMIAVILGVSLMFITTQIPLQYWERYAGRIFLLILASLVLVLIPHIGKEVNGAQRWIPLGIFNIQPSELMKIATIVYTADYATRKHKEIQSWTGFIPIGGAMIAVSVSLLLEPDLGGVVVISVICFAMLFMANMNKYLFSSLVVFLLISMTSLIWFSDYRRARLMAAYQPFEDPNGVGYQLSQALVAFGRGEWLGVGLGNSVAKQYWLPEAHTDFILAVIGEEFGLIGVITLTLTYFWLLLRIFQIGKQSAFLLHTFPSLVAYGVGVWLGVQFLINAGTNTGMLPTKGLTLPLMSYGGSSILMACIAMGLVLRVDYENRQKIRGGV